MNRELERVIGLFNGAQERAVEVLEREFGCPRPTTADDFILRCVPAIRKSGYISKGYKIRPHGIGIEVDIDGLKIDFDFGPNGEFNGFDSWRLFDFLKSNNIESPIASEEEMENLIEEAKGEGKIEKYSGMGRVYHVNS